MSAKARGGGEWTALRELKAKWLELADSAECYAEEAKRHSYPPEKIESHARTARTLKKCAADLEALAAAAPAPPAAFAYVCPANCGCMWRDNGDFTMSLFGIRSESCQVCEPLGLKDLIPVYVSPSPQDGQGAELPSFTVTTGALPRNSPPSWAKPEVQFLGITDAERKAYEKETAALGPSRGGSSSDLADSANLNVGDEVWVRAKVMQFIEPEHNGVEIRLEIGRNTLMRTWCNGSDLRRME